MSKTEGNNGTSDRDAMSRSRLKILKQNLIRLRSHSQTVIHLPCKPDNSWAFLVLSFLQRTERHVNSVERLLENRDVWLILRTMIEGMLILKWAAKIPADRIERAAKYQKYFWAAAHGRVRTQESQGRPLDENLSRIKNITRTELEKVAVQILNPFQSNNFFFDDRFDANETYKEITGLSISELFEDSNGKEVHQRMYNLYSSYHHWNPLVLGTYQDSDGKVYTPSEDVNHQVHALIVALVIYSETIAYAFEIFKHDEVRKIGLIQESLEKLMKATTLS